MARHRRHTTLLNRMGLSVKQRVGLELQRSLRHTQEQVRLMVRDVDGKENGD